MQRFSSTLAGFAVALLAFGHAHAAEPILQDRDALCDKPSVLQCLDAYYSDLESNRTPLGLDNGKHYPLFGGMFTTDERRKRAASGEEPALDGLIEGDLPDLLENDTKTAYRVLSAYPTARNLFLSLDLLAKEVSAKAPSENAMDYVFLTKIVESTLHAATVDGKPELYEAAERYRNCLVVSLAEGTPEQLRGPCAEALSAKAAEVLGAGASETE